MADLKDRNKRSASTPRRILLVGLFLIIGLGGVVGTIKLRMARAERQQPYPQAILILDGNDPRVEFGLTFAQAHPDLPIWISGYCSQRQAVYTAVSELEIDPERVFYDLKATDTVTHFTGMVHYYNAHHIRHVYLVTSAAHMTRAKTIAAIVFGSHGIIATPIAQPANPLTEPSAKEPWIKVARDAARSLTWLTFGFTGERFNGRTPADCD
jgi:uncharacterized SAM-binding protein YcdF (DUF218 family)